MSKTVQTPFGPHPFRVGQRVEMTEEARSAGLMTTWRGKTITKGKVVAVSTATRLDVKVLRDGLKTPGWYHVVFWRVARKPRSKPKAAAKRAKKVRS